MLLSILTIICFAFTIWLANVEFFFAFNEDFFLPREYFLVPSAFLILDLILSGKAKAILEESKCKRIVKLSFKPLMCLIYLILKIVNV
jgi:hypothetical protein